MTKKHVLSYSVFALIIALIAIIIIKPWSATFAGYVDGSSGESVFTGGCVVYGDTGNMRINPKLPSTVKDPVSILDINERKMLDNFYIRFKKDAEGNFITQSFNVCNYLPGEVYLYGLEGDYWSTTPFATVYDGSKGKYCAEINVSGTDIGNLSVVYFSK